MKKVVRAVALFLVLSFNLSYGYISTDYSLERGGDFRQVVESLKSSLEKDGITVHKTLPISEVIKGRGSDFDDYYVLVGCVGSKTEEILRKYPDLSNVLPCSIPVYKKDGKINVSVLNYRLFLLNMKDVKREDLRYIRSVYRRIESSLFRLGFKRSFYGYKKNTNTNLNFILTEKIGTQNIDDLSVLFKTSLEGINLNILDEMSLDGGKLRVYFVCNLTYGSKIFTSIPQFGVLAPCRLNLYGKDDGSLFVSMINIQTFLKIFEKVLTTEQKEIFLSIDKDIKDILNDLRENR